MKTRQQEQDSDFPYGWNRGDTCVMITNKAKKSTCEYTVESYDGRYFGVRSHTGLFHRASPQRLFHSKEEAVAALEQSETPTQKSRKRKCKKADGCICLRERLVEGCVPFEELLERFDSRGKCQPVCKPCGPFISTAFPYPLAGDEDIEKLNVLAQKIQAFPDQRTLAKFKAALELEIRNEIDFALDVAENLDCYDFDPKMYSPAAYAEEITVRKNKVREKNRLKGTYYRGENLAKYCNNELFLII